MAAGDIIIPNNTVTPELMQKIATEVQKLIAAGAKEPSQYEEVKSLANLTSLPALMQTGSAYRLVRVAVEILKGLDGKDVELQVSGGYIQWRKAGEAWNNLVSIESLKGDAFTFTDFTPEQLADLKKPATDAAAEAQRATTAATQATQAATTATTNADKATEAANTATAKAAEATKKADTAAGDATTAAGNANTAAGRVDAAILQATEATTKAAEATQAANTATSNANQATEAANQATEAATSATTKATEATTKATEATAKATTATTNAEGATQRANDAAAIAEELNANPPKPVAGNWHKYNTQTNQYEDTGIQAKGDPGQSFKIIGQYATLEELKAAIPDGSQSEGVYAVGAAYPYHYYAWINVGGVWQWADQGQLQGAEGKSAFEVWKELPGNAEKSEQDYLAYLQQPATEAAKQADAATARANTAASDANKATEAATTAAGEANKATEAANSATTQAQQATSHANTATDNANKATTAANEAAQAAKDAAASVTTPDIDHVPTEADTTYQAGSETHHYRPGDECRYFDPDLQEYVFYKLHDITPDGKAVWQEAGSGGSFKGEEVAILIESDQGNPDSGLFGLMLTVKIGIDTQYVAYGGQPLAIQVEKGKQCTITSQPKEGYTTPDPVTFTAEASGTREITLNYYAQSVLLFDLNQSAPDNITLVSPALINRLEASARKRHRMVRTDYGVKAAPLIDANSSLYADGTAMAAAGGNGDAMVHLPDIYTKATQESGGMTARVEIYSSPVKGAYLLKGGWLGVCKGSIIGGKLRSVEGKTPTRGVTMAEARKAATQRGAGYTQITYDMHCIIALLLYAKYATRDLQSVLGAGGACYDRNNTTGATFAMGNSDSSGETEGYVSGLGIEGVFGCLYEHLEGVTYKYDGWHVGDRLIAAPQLATGWIKTMAFEKGDRFDLLPLTVGASGTTYYTDYFEGVASEYLPMSAARSCITVDGESYQDDGIAYLNAVNTETNSNEFYGCRLAYMGEVELLTGSALVKLTDLDKY